MQIEIEVKMGVLIIAASTQSFLELTPSLRELTLLTHQYCFIYVIIKLGIKATTVLMFDV